ncbi:MAG: hypothetical protein V8R01_07835 [Bacilli bacterium]
MVAAGGNGAAALYNTNVQYVSNLFSGTSGGGITGYDEPIKQHAAGLMLTQKVALKHLVEREPLEQ